jgi:hypothetical protein
MSGNSTVVKSDDTSEFHKTQVEKGETIVMTNVKAFVGIAKDIAGALSSGK